MLTALREDTASLILRQMKALNDTLSPESWVGIELQAYHLITDMVIEVLCIK